MENNDLSKISRKLQKSQTLIITDQNDDKTNVMINFIIQDNSIIFELNRSNIIYEDLSLSKNILLVGGTELDAATIYKETEHELQNTKQKLQQQQHLLGQEREKLLVQHKKYDQQKQQINKQRNSIQQQKSQLKEQNKSIKQQRQLIQTREKELRVQQQTLLKNIDTLETIQNSLDASKATLKKNTNENINLSKLIKDNNEILKKQQEKLSNLEFETNQQQIEITTKENKITQQQTILYFIVSIGAFIIILVIVIYLEYLQKRQTAIALREKNHQLNHTMLELEKAQDQLIESEKMAALGTLVTGIAHEINTPLGIAFTVSSDAHQRTSEILELFRQHKVTATDFSSYCETMEESTDILKNSLSKVASLVQSFKEISIDQSAHQKSSFDLSSYIDEVSMTYKSLSEKHKHQFIINKPPSLMIHSYPGAFFQIFSTLILNSTTHAFKHQEGNKINISLSLKDSDIELIYSDNGPRVEQNIIDNIFDPFYTTNRGAGSTGLGCHILYNLTTQLLKGSIVCSQEEEGLIFKITIPIEATQ